MADGIEELVRQDFLEVGKPFIDRCLQPADRGQGLFQLGMGMSVSQGRLSRWPVLKTGASEIGD